MPSAAAAAKQHLLIVDDTPAFNRMMTETLTKHGYTTHTLLSGRHIFEAIEAKRPDLILLDVLMPELDGYEVCRRLKANPQTAAIPIIFISADDDMFNVVEAFEIGAADYIIKPPQMPVVIARIRTHISNMELRRRLSQQIETLDTFARSVAHDLKNPLTQVLNFSELLVEGIDEMDSKTVNLFLDQISRGGRRIELLIDDLLMLARARSEEIVLDRVDMAKIVQQALKQVETQIEDNNATVEVDDNWPYVIGQQTWLETVWINYLTNGLKYGGRPPVLKLRHRCYDGQHYFWVQDNGEGLSISEQEKLFQPFQRLAPEIAHGHGLGLSIVQTVLRKVNGRPFVRSTPGKGSKFGFTLPALPDNESS